MGRPTARQQLVRNARKGVPVERVAIPRVTCPRCASEVYADQDGQPRPHLRATWPGEQTFSEIVPTMADCDDY